MEWYAGAADLLRCTHRDNAISFVFGMYQQRLWLDANHPWGVKVGAYRILSVLNAF